MGGNNSGLDHKEICIHQYGQTWRCTQCGYEVPKTLQDKLNSLKCIGDIWV